MPGKMILTVGVPGSGKSTIAKQLKAADPENVVVVERDETRTMIAGEGYHRKNPDKQVENQVTVINEKLIKQGLAAGKTVVVSDTNINPRNVQNVTKIGRDYGAEISFEHFDVPPEECKRRNKARGAAGGREVPHHVMERMISQAYGDDGHLKEMKMASKTGKLFFVPKSTPGSRLIDKYNQKAEFDNPITERGAVIVDVDGTLASNAHDAEGFLHQPDGKQYDKFFKAIAKAPVNSQVRDLANRMRDEEGLNIVLLTGRSDSAAAELLQFVKKSGIKASRVICKKADDFRPDYDFKHEVIENMKKDGLVPVHAIDDREQSINTLQAHGIMVSRVDTPTFAPGADLRVPGPEPKVNTIYGSGYCIKCGSPLKNGGNIGPKCGLGGKD